MLMCGKHIQKLRKNRKIFQKEFGIKLGYNADSAQVIVTQYETDKRKPNERTLREMLKILDVNNDELAEFLSNSCYDEVREIISKFTNSKEEYEETYKRFKKLIMQEK